MKNKKNIGVTVDEDVLILAKAILKRRMIPLSTYVNMALAECVQSDGHKFDKVDEGFEIDY